MAGGVFDGFGGDVSAGPVGVGGEVARRWEMPTLWILQPLIFPVRAQIRAPYQLQDGQWDVFVFRDGNYEMHCPFNVTGHPALAMTAGFSKDGLPLSLQLAGRYWDEAGVMRAAAAFEREAAHHERHPPGID